MLLLARYLDWFCRQCAAGAQDELRLNQLIISARAPRSPKDAAPQRR
ncbi:hypothetical protein IL54_4889 [Sphingobium sp. ba1]|jgi:hypothetical protein|nr:hypothetical protein [Sphingobium sp. ba1]AOF95208.1 hypothetical protein BSY17_3799 [Sphingobium sp. RAC03]OMG61420.1 hypothetical protein IL54_4889 [Sphingobium sp. ba1]